MIQAIEVFSDLSAKVDPVAWTKKAVSERFWGPQKWLSIACGMSSRMWDAANSDLHYEIATAGGPNQT